MPLVATVLSAGVMAMHRGAFVFFLPWFGEVKKTKNIFWKRRRSWDGNGHFRFGH
jgi:hypothetical protein